MDFTQTQSIIIDSLTQYGIAVFIILSSVLVLGLAYFIYRWGWSHLSNMLIGSDIGMNIGGFQKEFKDDMEREAFVRGVKNNPNLWN